MLRLLTAMACVAAVAAQTPAPRTIVVIGDLHLGPGRDASGAWHPFEDFRWTDEFVTFLEALQAEGGDVDLVINGDLFELLQSTAVACRHGNPGLGCTAAEAVMRLETVIAAHLAELKAIGTFAAAGANRVHVVPGDHDAALLMPEVWSIALAAFGAPADRVVLASSGAWLSADGRVHVEHGHQLPLSASRFSGWPRPVVVAEGRTHLERPWGEQVLVPFFDRTEARYPIVDNIAEAGVGVKFVAAADPSPLPDAPALLRLLLTKTTWQQFRMDLDDGEVQAPAWDVARIRRDLPGFMAGSLPVDDPFASQVKQVSAANLLAAGEAFSDEQIVAVCDYRAAIRRARRRMERVLTQLAGVGPPIAECPRLPDTVGPAFEYYWRSRDRQVTQHVTRPGVEVIVFGHTHLMDRPFRPAGDAGPVVVTSGAWQRTIHPVDVKQIDAPLETLAPCYSFLHVPATPGERAPQARAWTRSDTRWSLRNGGC